MMMRHRKSFSFILLSTLVSFFILLEPVLAFEWGSAASSCCIGPRVGLEKNEGKEIEATEWVYALGGWVPYVGPLIVAWAAWEKGGDNGLKGWLASCCIGPRVGEQLHYRKIRTIEWFAIVPVASLVARAMIALDAGQGKTMSEIAIEEDLAK